MVYFKKGKQAAETHKKIYHVYEDDILTECICQKWFAKFRSKDFDVNDVTSLRPKIDSNNIKSIVADENPRSPLQ